MSGSEDSVDEVYTIDEAIELISRTLDRQELELWIDDVPENAIAKLPGILQAYRNNEHIRNLQIDFIGDLEFIDTGEVLFDEQSIDVRNAGLDLLHEITYINHLRARLAPQGQAPAAAAATAARAERLRAYEAAMPIPAMPPPIKEVFLEVFMRNYIEKCNEYKMAAQNLPPITPEQYEAIKPKLSSIITAAFQADPFKYDLANTAMNQSLLSFFENANAENFPLYTYEELVAKLDRPRERSIFVRAVNKFFNNPTFFNPSPRQMRSGFQRP